jgi:hypothetical protein
VNHRVESTELDSIPREWLNELADSGGLCESCGGVHIPDIDTAILALTAQREANVDVPHCTCSKCRTCVGFRLAVESIARSRQPNEEMT